MKNEIEIAKIVAKAYETGDFEPVFPFMSENVELHSMWVSDAIIGKSTVIQHYRNIEKNPAQTQIVRITGSSQEPHKVNVNGQTIITRLTFWSCIGKVCVLRKCMDGKFVLTELTINENGQLTQLHIMEPTLFVFENIS